MLRIARGSHVLECLKIDGFKKGCRKQKATSVIIISRGPSFDGRSATPQLWLSMHSKTSATTEQTAATSDGVGLPFFQQSCKGAL